MSKRKASPAAALFPTKLAAVAACLAAPHIALATAVSNCEDTGPGSLRQAIADTPDGGTIDATGLATVCSVITVKTGALTIGYDDVTIAGPGVDKLTITAELVNGGIHRYFSRIFTHTGRGTLTLKDLTLSSGIVNTPSNGSLSGGCIQSSANVSLFNTDVLLCSVTSQAQGSGGAIAAAGTVYAKNSRLLYNQAAGTNYGGFGGAIKAGAVTLRGSTIAANTLTSSTGNASVVSGGAIFAGDLDIASSTISGNTASGGRVTHYNVQGSDAGGIYARGTTAIISNSTISGNAAGYSGGLDISAGTVTITNSTVAFNRSSAASSSPARLGASVELTLDSDIFSNNTAGPSSQASDLAVAGSVSPAGTHNLVFASDSLLPGGTLRGACPLLGPLRFNGGPTQTHALWSRSPAIDAGDNPGGLPTDQRGSGYPRSSGATDIGSYEVEKTDEVFGSGFDGC